MAAAGTVAGMAAAGRSAGIAADPFGGRGPRMFDPGALRLVVLGLIAEQPRSRL